MDNLPSFDRQQLKAALRAAQRGSDYLHSLLNTIESCFNDEDWKLVEKIGASYTKCKDTLTVLIKSKP